MRMRRAVTIATDRVTLSRSLNLVSCYCYGSGSGGDGEYYQVTRIEIDKRLRLHKLHSMFKEEEIVNTANEAMLEILEGKDLNMTELNHLCAAAMVIIEEINGTGTRSNSTPLQQTNMGEYKWYQERTVSSGRNKKR